MQTKWLCLQSEYGHLKKTKYDANDISKQENNEFSVEKIIRTKPRIKLSAPTNSSHKIHNFRFDSHNEKTHSIWRRNGSDHREKVEWKWHNGQKKAGDWERDKEDENERERSETSVTFMHFIIDIVSFDRISSSFTHSKQNCVLSSADKSPKWKSHRWTWIWIRMSFGFG